MHVKKRKGNIGMTRLSQRDLKWGGQYIGFSTTYIKDFGCTITCLAMIIGTTPDVVNQRLKAVGGFQGNLIIWAKIPVAFSGIQARRVYTYNNDDVKANVPNVLVEVPGAAIGGTGKHWVVFIGSGRCNDPWTGLERATSDFTNYYPGATGYCVLTGKWIGLPPAPLNDEQKEQKIRGILGVFDTATNHIKKIETVIHE